MIWLLKYWKAFAVGFVLVGTFSTGWHIRARIAIGDIAELTVAHDRTLQEINTVNQNLAATMVDQARTREQRNVEAMAALDLKHTEELNNAKRETDIALAAVRAGELRLRNRFTCSSGSAAADRTTEAGTGTGLGDDTRQAGLQITDAEFLVRFADEADAVVRQLTACQAIVVSDRNASEGQ